MARKEPADGVRVQARFLSCSDSGGLKRGAPIREESRAADVEDN